MKGSSLKYKKIDSNKKRERSRNNSINSENNSKKTSRKNSLDKSNLTKRKRSFNGIELPEPNETSDDFEKYKISPFIVEK